MAAAGITLCLSVHGLPLAVRTALYLAMGWGVLACYLELARVLTPRGLCLAVLGGILYSAGALLNVLHWPVLWPDVVGPHEVFHVLVLGGSLCHFLFALTVVAPYQRPAPVVVQPADALRPAPVPAR
jgi:hemolysin III